jgi:hypothetical protein
MNGGFSIAMFDYQRLGNVTDGANCHSLGLVALDGFRCDHIPSCFKQPRQLC